MILFSGGVAAHTYFVINYNVYQRQCLLSPSVSLDSTTFLYYRWTYLCVRETAAQTSV